MKLVETNQQIEAIQKLSGSDMDGAMGLLHSLIKRLIEDDSFYVLAIPESQTESFLPYIAPIRNLPYLRVFSDSSAAESFVSQSNITYSIISLDSIHLVKLCKYWMLMGAEGFILNDGQKWTAVTMDQFLAIFFQDVLDYEEAIDQDYLPVAKLCIQLLRGEQRFIQKDGIVNDLQGGEMLSVDVLPEDGKSLVIDGVQTTGKRLKLLMEEISHLRDPKCGMTLSSEDSIYSFSPSNSYPYQEIDPSLSIQEPQEKILEKGEKFSIKIQKPKWFEQKKIPHIAWPKNLSHKKGALAAGLVLVVLVSAYVGSGLISASKFGEMCSERSYQEAVVYYQGQRNPVFKMSANEKVDNAIESVLNDYLDETISAEEATASLSVLSSIPKATESVGQVKTTVDTIEQSRKAYFAGAQTDQVIERLYYWLDVKKEDSANFEAVEQDIRENGEKYAARAVRIADALTKSGKRAQAKWCFELLNTWFPTGGYEERISMMSDIDSEPMEITPIEELGNPQTTLNPIEIYDVDVSSPDGEGYVDLYVRWKNTGTKTIQEVIFYVVPLDDFGGVLSSNRDGNYSMYSARDIGPYKPGEGTPSESWAWENVWNNSMIAAAEVQQVVIFYTDGSVKSIENPEQLMT